DHLGKIDPLSTADFQILHGQEFHTSYWGHLGLLNVRHLIIPGYAAYPNTAASSLFPTNAAVADLAHAQSNAALVGYAHPFDESMARRPQARPNVCHQRSAAALHARRPAHWQRNKIGCARPG